MFFGNQKLFKGELYYTLGNLEMGDRGFITQNNVHPVIHLTPYPAGCKIKLTQILLNSTIQPLTYLHNATLIDTSAIPALDMSVPSFVRIGVYDSSDNPLAFGQPIVILGLQTGLNDFSATNEPGIKIYPNPANDKLNIELNFSQPGNFNVRILNMNGQQVGEVDDKYFYKGKHGYSIDIGYLTAGQYFIEIAEREKSYTQQFVVK
jgi:subtilisin family serine protease